MGRLVRIRAEQPPPLQAVLEGDAGREIEPRGKDTDYIAGRDADVLTMARVVQGCFSRAQWIGDDRRVDRQRKHTRKCEDQPDADNTIAPCERRFPSSVRTRSEPPHVSSLGGSDALTGSFVRPAQYPRARWQVNGDFDPLRGLVCASRQAEVARISDGSEDVAAQILVLDQRP